MFASNSKLSNYVMKQHVCNIKSSKKLCLHQTNDCEYPVKTQLSNRNYLHLQNTVNIFRLIPT